jgi:hypothetical protein
MHLNQETASFFEALLPYRIHSPIAFDKMMLSVDRILHTSVQPTVSMERLIAAEQHARDYMNAAKQFHEDVHSQIPKLEKKLKRFTRTLYNEQLRVIHGKCIQTEKKHRPAIQPPLLQQQQPPSQDPFIKPLQATMGTSSDFPSLQPRFSFPPLPSL